MSRYVLATRCKHFVTGREGEAWFVLIQRGTQVEKDLIMNEPEVERQVRATRLLHLLSALLVQYLALHKSLPSEPNLGVHPETCDAFRLFHFDTCLSNNYFTLAFLVRDKRTR